MAMKSIHKVSRDTCGMPIGLSFTEELLVVMDRASDPESIVER